jgi:hypothetical protein
VAVLASEIITRAQDILSDAGATRWTSAELLRWVNDAQFEIAVAQPEASLTVTNVQLAAGTKQSLPAGSIALSRINRNMGVGGATPGETPRPAARALMDQHRPSWHSDTSTLVVKNYFPDPRHPRTFYVWPPMTSATYVECEYSVIPAAVAAAGDPITLPDFYRSPILDYVLYRAFAKEVEIEGLVNKSKYHRDAFEKTLGLTAAGEEAVKP